MAEMIPSEIFYGEMRDTTSTAEIRMFDIIKETPNTQDWIVFHSLDVKNHECLTFTESDFVILIPSKGIFIIEVKGGKISYHNGRFISYDKYGTPHEISPFKQVERAKYGIREYLKRHNINNILLAAGVAFLDVEFDIDSIEYDKSMVFDAKKQSFYDYIINLERLTKVQEHKSIYLNFTGDKFTCTRKLLRDDYDLHVPFRQKIKDRKYEVEHLTKQQRDVLDEISCNEKALVHGGAGTGKTYLAVQLAKRCYNNGYKVGIFSYNILLADFLKDQFPSNKYPKIIVGAILEYLLQYCKDLQLLDKDFNPMALSPNKINSFYKRDIYKLALEALQLKPLNLDVLILDEAQDYVEPNKLMLLSLMLKHNLARGKWYMFGDYINQLIFDFSVYEINIKQYLKAMGVDHYLDKELSENCRNSQAIADELLRLTGVNIPVLKGQDSGLVKYIKYKDENEEVSIFENLLDALIKKEKILPEQITILTNCKFEDSFPIQMSKYNHMIKQYEYRDKGVLSHARLRRFKGLENDIIIMMDLNNYRLSDMDMSSIHLLYTGVSRAHEACYVLETANEKRLREEAYKSREGRD